jgi:cytochrome d ubiquinol oxidase subunit I
MTAHLLARLQFAFTVSFHILFPAFTIGLASYLAVLEGLWLATRRDVFIVAYRFWVTIFAVAFAMGVVSGLVMSYEFGTNWGPFAEATAPVLGPLLAYEVLTAFFLEAGFLGVMLFGMQRVGKSLHFLATLLVATGTLISAFWILAANSWMQTPSAYLIENGRFVPQTWLGVIFNPSFPFRFAHMVLAAYLATAFAVGATAAWHLLRDRAQPVARLMFAMAVSMAIGVAPLQLFVGDLHGRNSTEHQPEKIAALEGHFESRREAPFYVVGWPDVETARMQDALAIPKLGSLLLYHDANAEVTGLDRYRRADWPNVPLVFFAFRLMVGVGLSMIAFGVVGAVQWLRGRLYDSTAFLRAAVLMGPLGFVAILSGWVVTEAGRQPWVVYGLMRTADGASPIGVPGVAGSLLGFILVYSIVFAAGVTYMLRLMRRAPSESTTAPIREGPLRSTALIGDADAGRPP